MNHISNFIFVLINSAYLVPAVATFLVLGFALGYVNWAKSARRYRELKTELDKLESRYNKATPTVATNSASPLTSASFTAGALWGLGTVGKRFHGEEHLVNYSEEMGVLYKEKPSKVDDLTQLPEINRRTEARMNKQGIYTFKQIETLNPRQQKVYQSKYILTNLTWDSSDGERTISSVATAGFTAGTLYGLGKVGQNFRGEEDLITYSEEFGPLYKEKPTKADDLTELAGIDQRMATRMNENGIYTFKQIESLNPRQRDIYKSKYKLTDLAWKTPDLRSEKLTDEVDLEPAFDPNFVEEPEPDRVPEPKESNPNTPKLTAPKPKNSKVTKPVKLVGAETKALTNPRVDNAISEMGVMGERFIGEEDRLALDDELGLIYEQKPDFVDDLTVLKGIDTGQAAQINQVGIYTFKQLEAMNDSERHNFEKLFDLKNVKWDRWGLQLGWGGIGGSPIGFGKMINDQIPEEDS